MDIFNFERFANALSAFNGREISEGKGKGEGEIRKGREGSKIKALFCSF